MPAIEIPGLGFSVKWTRHNILTVTTSSSFGFPPLTLRLARSALTNADLSDLALNCLRSLPRLWSPGQSKEWVAARGKTTQLRVLWRDWPVKITVTHTDLTALQRAWKIPGYRQELFDYLHIGVLLPTAICATPSAPSGHLARGRNPMARLLAAILPTAFLFAHKLVQIVTSTPDWREEERLVAHRQAQVRAILREHDDTAGQRPLQTTDAVYLVERAFQGAWEPCGLTPPSEGGVERDYFSHYLYRPSSRNRMTTLAMIAVLLADSRPTIVYMQWWTALLLGPPGSAAHAFGLLPKKGNV